TLTPLPGKFIDIQGTSLSLTDLPIPPGVPVTINGTSYSWVSGGNAHNATIADDGSGSITSAGITTVFPAGTKFRLDPGGGYTVTPPAGLSITQTDQNNVVTKFAPGAPVHVASADDPSIIPASYIPDQNFGIDSAYVQNLVSQLGGQYNPANF